MELILVACLLAAPDQCREHHVRLTIQGGDPGQCMYASPPQIAHWQQLHVKWKVRSWRCAMVGDDELI